MRPRVLYEVDPHNRLIVKRSGVKSRVKRFRKIIYGRFKTDTKNKLYYEISKSSVKDFPQKIEFSGKYALDRRHNLIFTLNKWNNQVEKNRLRLRTRLTSLGKREIVFLLNSGESQKKKPSYIMKLYGSWQADKNNRLTFGVKRKNDKKDTLTLFNAWQINKNNEIAYSHGTASQVFTLKGKWRAMDRYRLDYTLDKRISSGFDFRASLGQVIPRNKKTYIKFDIAIDVSKKRRLRRKIIFICKYKLGKGKKIILKAYPHGQHSSFKLTKEILDRRGILYIESLVRDKERYFGGGLVFRW